MNATVKSTAITAGISLLVCFAYDMSKKGIVWAAEKIKEKDEEKEQPVKDEEKEQPVKAPYYDVNAGDEDMLRLASVILDLSLRFQSEELTIESIDKFERELEFFVAKTKEYIEESESPDCEAQKELWKKVEGLRSTLKLAREAFS